jgi:type II secretory pathway pseudopilin PulG
MRRFSRARGFSIVEALIAMGLVVLALVGLFAVMPYTYRTLENDSLRAEAASVAQRYFDDVRLAVQSGEPVPAPTAVPIDFGASFMTDQQTDSVATVDLSAACVKPAKGSPSLFDCTITVGLTTGGERRELAPLESYIARQLP